jgi:hypothetical protein
LWSSVLAEFELSGHELTVLRQAVRAADRCEALAAALAETGLTQRTAHGAVKLNPLAAELRSAELGLCRLLLCLRAEADVTTPDIAAVMAAAIDGENRRRELASQTPGLGPVLPLPQPPAGPGVGLSDVSLPVVGEGYEVQSLPVVGEGYEVQAKIAAAIHKSYGADRPQYAHPLVGGINYPAGTHQPALRHVTNLRRWPVHRGRQRASGGRVHGGVGAIPAVAAVAAAGQAPQAAVNVPVLPAVRGTRRPIFPRPRCSGRHRRAARARSHRATSTTT